MKSKCNDKNKKNRTKGQGKKKNARLLNATSAVVLTIFAKKYRTLQHLFELYQKSLKKANGVKRSYEAHFNDVSKEATTSGTKEDPKIPRMMYKEDMDLENTIVKYNSNGVFGDLD
jgi:hypothetical protein